MNYEKILEMDNITIQDCIDMYTMKNLYTIIEDGKVKNFHKEGE